jgi:hypothetical protein
MRFCRQRMRALCKWTSLLERSLRVHAYFLSERLLPRSYMRSSVQSVDGGLWNGRKWVREL